MERQAGAKVQVLANRRKPLRPRSTGPAAAHPLLRLQSSIGNQAVQRLIRSPYIQTKLQVSAPGDPFEQEADRVADSVMRMAEPKPATDEEEKPLQTKSRVAEVTPLAQRVTEQPQVIATPTHSSVSIAPPLIQRTSEQPSGQMDAAPASVNRTLASPGRSLEPALRQDMEQRFGYDFSRVRLHSGEAAEQSAREVNAHAYTVGHNIVFGSGRFAPGTHEGKRLLAHEMTHVVQQSGPLGNPVGQSNENRGLYAPGLQQRSPIPAHPTAIQPGLVQRDDKGPKPNQAAQSKPPLSPTEVPMEAQIRHELERELPEDAEAEILGRKRELIKIFSRFNEWDAMVLHGRLSARAPSDSLASLFHHRLATPTRDQMLGILLRRSRRADEPALEFTDPADRYLEGLELIVMSPRILVDADEHPEETVMLNLWSRAPFPPVVDFTAQFFVEREETGAQGAKGVTLVTERVLPWTVPIKNFSVSVTAQHPGLHRVTLKILNSKQQVVRIIRQTFEVETTIPQDLAALKGHPQYADSVVMAYYDLYRGPLRGGGVSTWLPVQYADGSIIDLNFSDFGGSNVTPFRWDNGKIFPQDINTVTAPNLTAIKHAADLVIDDYTVLMIIQATTAVVLPTITGVPMRVGPAPMATARTAAAQRPRAAPQVRPGPPSSGAPPVTPEPTVPVVTPEPTVPVKPPVPPAVGGGGPASPSATPIGGAIRTNVRPGQTIVDTDTLIALDKAAQPGVKLSPGEQQIVASSQGRSIVATPTSVGQFRDAGQRGTVPVTQSIAHTAAERQAIVQDLEAVGLGGSSAKGAADRDIVANALLAQPSEPGFVPVFQPSDHGIINGLARLDKTIPTQLPKGYNVAEYLRYERGVGVFAVTVRGRVLVIRPIQEIRPRR